MAVVEEYKLKSGVTIKINDAAYKDKSKEEMEETLKNINATASRLLYRQLQRR